MIVVNAAVLGGCALELAIWLRSKGEQMNKSYQNVSVASDFISKSGGKARLNPAYGESLFRGLVTYKAGNGSVSAETVVKICMNGFEEGKISLEESDELPVDRFHLDFSPDFQVYGVGDDGALVVSGSSPKMGGKYSVTIRPLESVDPKKHYGGSA